jgi:small-conductance mechanosensitive channel
VPVAAVGGQGVEGVGDLEHAPAEPPPGGRPGVTTMGSVPSALDPARIPEPWSIAAAIVVAWAIAWLGSRWAGRAVEALVWRYERRKIDPSQADTGVLIGMKRRDTAASLLRTTVRYAAYGAALVFTVAHLSGSARITTIASASLLVLLVGFAAQRFLTDVLAGFFMFFDGWFAVGDTVTIEPWGLQGVVEELSLRATKLRAVNGETIRVHNSQIYGVRVLPRGVRELDIELFASDEQAARALVDEVARMVPTGPLHFIRRPWVAEAQRLDDDLVRIKARATVAPGREWLAREFLPDVLKERAGEDLIVHGPVVMDVDDIAVRRYERSLAPPGRMRDGGGPRDAPRAGA